MSKTPTALCALDDIADGGTIAVDTKLGRKAVQLIALRTGDTVRLYVNSCPHVGSPLDFTPGQFLNAERDKILCATHGALFEMDSGLCVQGPCAGESLEAVACEVRDGQVWLA